MAKSQDARERILALERIRTVETELIQKSLVLIQRLQVDWAHYLGTEVPDPSLQLLQRGEQWWRPKLDGYTEEDPRAFPIVQEVAEQLEFESSSKWQPDPKSHDGICYKDLVPTMIKILDRRTALARIAGVN